MSRLLAAALWALTACPSPLIASAAAPNTEQVFADAQRAYHQKDFERALSQLQTFLEHAKADDPRRFGAVEQVARIHLQIRRDAQAAIAFLETVGKTTKLSEVQRDDVGQWLATAREWRKMGALKASDNADKLFKLGKKYYNQGVADTDGPGDETGAAARYIAASYLVPFVQNYDGDPRLAKALLMLGDIRRRSWKDEEWWTEEFYLKEVIRRFPNTPDARRAYVMLDEDIRMRWGGSTGDKTPEYLRRMLDGFKARAYGPAKSRPATK